MNAAAARPLVEIRPAMQGDAWSLTEAERAEAGRFLRIEDRQRFIAARSLLRRMAGSTLGAAPGEVRIERDALRKPILAEAPDYGCNVTHSGGFVAAAIGVGRQIGIDIEQHRPELNLDALATTFMTKSESTGLAALGDVGKVRYFFRQWCFKEALVKALGTGLTRDPKRFEILFDGNSPQIRFVGAGANDIGDGWRLEDLAVPENYSGAIAWR